MKKTSLLRNKNLILLLLGGFISSLGTSIRMIALPLYIFNKTGSYLSLTMMMVILMGPSVILAPYAGAIADKFNRKKIMVISDFYRAVIILLILFVANSTATLFLLCFLLSVGEVFFGPAYKSLYPELFDKEILGEVNTLFSITLNFSYIVGPIIGGLLVFNKALAFDGISFLVSGLLLMFVSYKPAPKENIHKQTKRFEGFLEVKSVILENPNLRNIILLVLGLAFSFGLIPAILPGYISEVLKLPNVYYGYFLSALTFGGLIGATLSKFIIKKIEIEKLFNIAYIIYFLMFLLVPLSKDPTIIIGIFLIRGMAMTILGITSMTLEQKLVPGELLGKFYGMLLSIQTLIGLFSRVISGLVAEFSTSTILFYIAFLIMFVTFIFVTFSSKLNRAPKEIPSNKIV